ncbi:MAG TPA: DUF932 domain-containing protein [Polyangiaceae bacterium]|jgi:hypothetical protein|nr:DUF932 domain-containing protein [Polyangiaceae bacterium]
MLATPHTSRAVPSRFSPLTVRPDMASSWSDADTDFDTAADRIVKAHSADGEARDQPILELRTWAMTAKGEHLALQPIAGHLPARVLRAGAFSNLMTRLNAPAEFVRDRLPAPLQLATVNYLLTQSTSTKSATLRLRGEEIASLVSDRYTPLEPEELLGTVRGVLDRQDMLGRARVRSIATGTVDVLRLVFPGEERAIQIGDVTAVGLDISTSCFARSALHVRGLLWRLRCTNGLRVAEHRGQLSFRHVGDIQRMKDGLAEAIPSCIARARGVMDAWERSVHVMIDQVSEMVESLQLTVAERLLVEEELTAELGVPDLPESASLYDVTNAVTAAARQAEPARRLELETVAGEALERHTGQSS